MTASTTAPLPPIRRTVQVSWDPSTAFRHFTAEFADWWPRKTHSIGGARVKSLVFECRTGGLIVEELLDGRRFQWGRVTAFEPPGLVAFSWHPSRDEAQAQDVEVRFTPEGTGTRVELIASGWERLGERAGRERKGYDIGWGSVLEVFAGRKSVAFVVFAVLASALTLALRVSGRLEASIDKAGGRLPAKP